jgi:hypothetical protein
MSMRRPTTSLALTIAMAVCALLALVLVTERLAPRVDPPIAGTVLPPSPAIHAEIVLAPLAVNPVESRSQVGRSDDTVAEAITRSGGCVLWTFPSPDPVEAADPDPTDPVAMARYRAAKEFLEDVERRQREPR